MYSYKSLSVIADEGIAVLDEAGFRSESKKFDSIIVRSTKLTQSDLTDDLKCIGRAGAGVDNIPVSDATDKGIVVFNSPGANANAVKELVVCGLLLASRGIVQGSNFSNNMELDSFSDNTELNKSVEQNKKTFQGNEVFGKTLGIIGLGAIGSLVARAARNLGMQIIGYDPYISIESAWKLSSEVKKAESIDQLLKKSDYISLHVPLVEDTKALINSELIKNFKKGAKLINLSRGGIVDDLSVISALDQGVLSCYVTDFPSKEIITRSREHNDIIVMPHIGASTNEAKINCAVMAANQMKDFLINGNVTNSVNFPSIVLERTTGHRVIVINSNEPGMIGKIADQIADDGFNIADMSNKSKDNIAINLIDLDTKVTDELICNLKTIDHVISVRKIEH
ncbi:3-phosphoglycerate dehydrogenase family protein [SAR86 cluster bacterium]|nr:3-phosphoglycerate dehydrogenase family protein [SAR86 cluster bacterium]